MPPLWAERLALLHLLMSFPKLGLSSSSLFLTMEHCIPHTFPTNSHKEKSRGSTLRQYLSSNFLPVYTLYPSLITNTLQLTDAVEFSLILFIPLFLLGALRVHELCQEKKVPTWINSH